MNVKKKILRKPLPVIFGIKGYKLNDREKIFFKKTNPLGFIFFERNCKNKKQVKSLVDNLKNLLSHDKAFFLIDQEGGRVSRLNNPIWKKYPTAKYFGDKAKKDLLNAKELTFKNSLRIAKDLKELGINMNCAPVLDVTYDYTNNVIGDRSFSSDPKIVYELAKSFCKAHKKMKVMPVIKHIPGHGSSDKDSHKTTPIVNLDINLLNKKDFFPFKRLNKESAAMVAHIIYNRIDNKLACYSKIIIEKIIRKKIGFTGLLFSDDINMKALKGSIKSRVKNILNSGCDIILHCNANLNEMVQIYKAIPLIKNKTLKKVSVIKRLV
ncbi:MAG: Beta-hexosaminidase [Alphaproteobacteria bacterium MarineAlpha6_Bin6]|nr:beta-N-acetylhexosaminidase [Pelagibacteraceae bacterium]PPR32214.1 MAG: Beta-hexosaminidase [Alphaproteobacteria bacterium MarineAlpha6_Bin6]PPR33303.1 MAG: Beta-hexosaminidase [Alphaproteobacteria bacterium MarineAlpha6_Bin5]|tara:strand:- start:982 stop:1950 length:969 start_codon:yes stop_codon:yes gene_type:complete